MALILPPLCFLYQYLHHVFRIIEGMSREGGAVRNGHLLPKGHTEWNARMYRSGQILFEYVYIFFHSESLVLEGGVCSPISQNRERQNTTEGQAGLKKVGKGADQGRILGVRTPFPYFGRPPISI